MTDEKEQIRIIKTQQLDVWFLINNTDILGELTNSLGFVSFMKELIQSINIEIKNKLIFERTIFERFYYFCKIYIPNCQELEHLNKEISIAKFPSKVMKNISSFLNISDKKIECLYDKTFQIFPIEIVKYIYSYLLQYHETWQIEMIGSRFRLVKKSCVNCIEKTPRKKTNLYFAFSKL